MVYPPPVLPVDRANDDPVLDLHPSDHNALGLGLNDITTRLKADIAVRRQYTANGSIPNAVWTRCSVASTTYTYGDIRGDGTEIISDIGGFFLLMGNVEWAGGGTGNGRRGIGFSTATATVPLGDYQDFTAGETTAQSQQVCLPMYVSAPTGARFVLWVWQDSAAAMTLVYRSVTVVRLGPAF